jgi:hypothetical protein
MFLLPSLLIGILLAVALGGRLERLLEVRFRLPGLIPIALTVQVIAFSRFGDGLPDRLREPAHLASYGLLVAFGLANLRIRPLGLTLLGLTLNAIAIGANSGRMPVSTSAARAVGITTDGQSNVTLTSHHLQVLGDVFALPHSLPLANVFSVGDLLIMLGVASFIVITAIDDGQKRVHGLSRMTRPLRNRAFRQLAAGKLVSQTGDWLTTAAVVGWIYHATGSTTDVAALMLARLVPPILGSGIAAIVVDRLSKHRLLVLIEVSRGVAALGVLIGIATGHRPAVFAAIAVSGALAAMSAAAVPVLVPALVPVEQYASANASLGLAENVAMALGSASAGVALSSVGVRAALVIDIATFAAAALIFSRLRLTPVQSRRKVALSPLAGLRYLLGRRSMLVLVGSFAAATLATGLANATLPRFLTDGFGLGLGSYGFGFAALAVGLALGEGSVGFVRVGTSPGRWIGVGLAMMAGLFGLLAFVQHAPTALLVLMAIGFVDGTTDIVFDTAVQREADPRYHGAIFGFATASFSTTMMVAVALAPLANRVLAANTVLLVTAFFLTAAAAVSLLGTRRRDPTTFAQPTEA